MIIPRFTYREPDTLEACLSILKDHGHGASPLAGGTDLLVDMKKGLHRPRVLVSLARIPGLAKISENGGRSLRIGAMATMDAILSCTTIREGFPLLAQAAQKLGSPLIRNRATLGGNLATARPAADSHGPLICLDGRVRLASLSGERDIPAEAFFQGPGQTVRRPDEVVTQVVIDRPPPRSGGAYLKYGIRKTLEIGVVNVAALLSLDKDGTVIHVRVALGAVAPMTIRATSAEKCLMGKKPDERTIQGAAKAAVNDCQPITDTRGSAGYRRMLVEVLTHRAIEDALSQVSLA
jgi:CO/xanthine dehydrogenase FAD-binding subunit